MDLKAWLAKEPGTREHALWVPFVGRLGQGRARHRAQIKAAWGWASGGSMHEGSSWVEEKFKNKIVVKHAHSTNVLKVD